MLIYPESSPPFPEWALETLVTRFKFDYLGAGEADSWLKVAKSYALLESADSDDPSAVNEALKLFEDLYHNCDDRVREACKRLRPHSVIDVVKANGCLIFQLELKHDQPTS